MTAMSPRVQPERLHSTVVRDWGTPRKTQTVLQTVSLARGKTVKAGAARRARLTRGIVIRGH